MRLVWSTDHIDLLRKFATFLSSKGIIYAIEESVDRNWGSDNFGTKNFLLWIQEEDDFEKVKEFLADFLQNPASPEFTPQGKVEKQPLTPQVSISPTKRFIEEKMRNKLKPEYIELKTSQQKSHLTNLLIVICCIVLLLEMWTSKEENDIPQKVKEEVITTSPFTKALLFDYPEKNVLLDKVASLYGYKALAKPKDLPQPGKFLYEKYLKTESYDGIYPILVDWAREKRGKKPVFEASNEAPLFEKIKEGEIWRLVTPIFLHGNILHLFFNMIWLLILGIQIEERLYSIKYLLFIAIAAIFSNVCQYLVSGPAFIGFSGVICSMAFFIRQRQKLAPWEGYQMNSATFMFIVFFIGTLAFLSTLSFILSIFGLQSFSMGIADTAHLTGAFSGYLLGKSQYFSWHTKNDFS